MVLALACKRLASFVFLMNRYRLSSVKTYQRTKNDVGFSAYLYIGFHSSQLHILDYSFLLQDHNVCPLQHISHRTRYIQIHNDQVGNL